MLRRNSHVHAKSRGASSCWVLRAVGLLFGIICPLSAGAEGSAVGVSSLPMDEIKNASEKSRFLGNVHYEFTQYTSSIADRPELNQSQLVQAHLQGDSEAEQSHSRYDFAAGRYTNFQNSFFDVPELYIASRADRPVEVTVGRRLEDWSKVDRDWQLGLWQPLGHDVDRLRPLDEGLLGVFAETHSGDWNLVAYGSPIFVPTMDPNVQEKNGNLVSDTRWGTTTPKSGEVLSTNTNFVYNLQVPETSKIISHPGAGLRLMYGGHGPGAFAQAGYAYKPENTLFYRIDYNLMAAQATTADIAVVPDVLYHHLYGADAGWLYEKGRVSVSFLRDEPVAQAPSNDVDASGAPSTDWVRQNPGDLKIYAAHADTSFDVDGFRDPVLLALDYMKAEETETRDWDAQGNDRGELIGPNRMDFNNAAMIRTTVTTRLGGRLLQSSLRFVRDFEQNGSLFSLCEDYSPARFWALQLGVDVLSVDDDSASNTSRQFLNTFRANDRFYGGVSYVF